MGVHAEGGNRGMIAVARGRHAIFGTGSVGTALARALQESGRTVVSIPVNKYGSDPVNTTIMRGESDRFRVRLAYLRWPRSHLHIFNGPAKD